MVRFSRSSARLALCLILGVLVLGGACAAGLTGALAGSLPKPQGKPILVISGKIRNTNEGATAVFDCGQLEALGMETVVTSNPWYDGRQSFAGVRLDKLMQLVGATGKTVEAVALNDYSIPIPIDDFSRFKVILALKRNGKYMPVRDKGPLFIIYPYDSDPQLQSQTYYARSAWQVDRLTVR